MNIQQYYRSIAHVALNGSLVAFMPVILILGGGMLFSVQLPLFLITLPFCLYSFICYQDYLIQNQRSLESSVINSNENKSILNTDNLLITFMPAPSLRMLLFEPNGNLIGEVRDERFWWWRWFLPYFLDRLFPKVYGLYDHKNHRSAMYHINLRKKQVKIFTSSGSELGCFTQSTKTTASFKRRGVIHSFESNQTLYVEGSTIYQNLYFRNEQGNILGKVIKGWMPMEWAKPFRNANTPFITFDEDLNESDKILMISVLTEMYHYTSH